ncbi:MAG: chromosome segregation protein SMC, partial [Burkholderiales bacterium]
GTEIEAETARLRAAEARLEESRQSHYAASDAVNDAQGFLYEANAEVARLENQLQYMRDSRKRLETQQTQLREQLASLATERDTTAQETIQWQGQADQGAEQLGIREADLERENSAFPEAELAHRQASEVLAAARGQLAQMEQAKSLADTHRGHAERILQQLDARRGKLHAEKQSLVIPDSLALTQLATIVASLNSELSDLQQSMAAQQGLAPQFEQALAQANTDADHSQVAAMHIEAQIQALENLQAQQHRDEKVQQFLTAHGLQTQPKLWQAIQVEPGWEDALESVIGMRLTGIQLDDLGNALNLQPAPPPGVTLFAAGKGEQESDQARLPWTPLAQRIVRMEPETAGVLNDWLSGVYVVESWQEALPQRERLANGAMFVSKDGHLVTRHTLSFFAPQAEMHGLIARAREIVGLKNELTKLQQALAAKRETAAEADRQHRENRQQVVALQTQFGERQSAHHAREIERLQLSQQLERANQRNEQIQQELFEIANQAQHEASERDKSQRELAAIERNLAALVSELVGKQDVLRAAETTLQQCREAKQSAERALQEAKYFSRSCSEKLHTLETATQSLARRSDEFTQQHSSVETELSGLLDDTLVAALQTALGLRTSRETALTQCRESLEGIAQSLTGIEHERLESEQKIIPLKDKINDLRLKEQEARLNEENFAEQLLANGGVEAELLPLVEKGSKANVLAGEVTRLNADIEILGAVNLAALSELETAQQRKSHLDMQSDDLNEAVETLENAMRRIDRETRERLQDTFNQVNENFGSLFPTLFGGGQARIELTGEEILDAGVAVIAQPPGKKTSSIHLLSGGEKALTAIALVFAMFRLNPAPFCLLDEVDAPLDDTNTERFCELVKKMSEDTQFLFISHNKITMEMANQLIGITMQESGVSRVVDVDMEQALRITEEAAA